MYDLGGDPLSAAGADGGFGQGFSFTDIMDAFFGQNAQRGPRPRSRRGQDALIRLEVELAEAAFGTTREIQVDTAVACPKCHGDGAAPGSEPIGCETCHGRGEIQHVPAFVPRRRSVTTRPCPNCRGYGIDHPRPLQGMRRRRPRTHPQDAHRQAPCRCRHRHADPARR